MGGITNDKFLRPLRLADELDHLANTWRKRPTDLDATPILDEAQELLRATNVDCPEMPAARALVTGPRDNDALPWVLSDVAAALRRASKFLLGDGSDDDLRVATLMRLDQIRMDSGDGARCGHNDLARDFVCDPAQMKRVAKWLIDRGLVESEGSTMGHGMSLELTGDGIDKLNELKSPHPAQASQPDYVDFDLPDLSFVHDPEVRSVLDRNALELQHASSAGLYTAAIVLVGAIAEGVLYDAIVARKQTAMASPKAPKNKNGIVVDPETDGWNFYAYIEVAEDLRLFRETTKKMLHGTVRDFRNMIHPKVQVSKGLKPDGPEMKSAVAWLEAVIRDIKAAT